MKLEQLRKVIREEVRAAVKNEFQDMLNEAVKIASKPEQDVYKNTPVQTAKPTITSAPVREHINGNADPIAQLLEQTRANMTSDEYKHITNSQGVHRPNFATTMASSMGMTENTGPQPGLDISQFDFVKKAGDIYKASVEKDKQKYGIA